MSKSCIAQMCWTVSIHCSASHTRRCSTGGRGTASSRSRRGRRASGTGFRSSSAGPSSNLIAAEPSSTPPSHSTLAASVVPASIIPARSSLPDSALMWLRKCSVRGSSDDNRATNRPSASDVHSSGSSSTRLSITIDGDSLWRTHCLTAVLVLDKPGAPAAHSAPS